MRCRLGGESVGADRKTLSADCIYFVRARVCLQRPPAPPTPNNINEIPDRGFMSLDLQQPGRVAQGKWSDPAAALLYTPSPYYFTAATERVGGRVDGSTLEKLATNRAQNAKRETSERATDATNPDVCVWERVMKGGWI